MAKVGNEAKLIMSLARERMDKRVEKQKQSIGADSNYTLGYQNAVNMFNNLIDEVIIELEAGK